MLGDKKAKEHADEGTGSLKHSKVRWRLVAQWLHCCGGDTEGGADSTRISDVGGWVGSGVIINMQTTGELTALSSVLESFTVRALGDISAERSSLPGSGLVTYGVACPQVVVKVMHMVEVTKGKYADPEERKRPGWALMILEPRERGDHRIVGEGMVG